MDIYRALLGKIFILLFMRDQKPERGVLGFWVRYSHQPFAIFCNICNMNLVHNAVHKFCSCDSISQAWTQLRELTENLDLNLIFESDHALLHLYYSEPLSSPLVLWLIGEYVNLVESIPRDNNKITGSRLKHHLRCKWLDCTLRLKYNLGFIPGLFQSWPILNIKVQYDLSHFF